MNINFQRNNLIFGDNLEIMERYMPDKCVDLIYLDPPFSSNRNYNQIIRDPNDNFDTAQVEAFDDTWSWNDTTEDTFRQLQSLHKGEDVVNTVEGFYQILRNNSLMAYLIMMTPRLLEMKRLLKDTGSIYLHCDPAASHYLKIIMDAIFCIENFRNEIVWCYKGWNTKQKQFPSKHDIILFYTKTSNNVFNILYQPLRNERLKKYGTKKLKNIIVNGKMKLVPTEEESLGSIIPDWWEIQYLARASKERIGYPTQKPLELVERIIHASSNKNNIIFDPFCGGGTTLHAAHNLNRRFIGIDITTNAIALIKIRLLNFCNLQEDKDYIIEGEPKTHQQAEELAEMDKYKFQGWVISKLNALPGKMKGNGIKKGKDGGIDGRRTFKSSQNKNVGHIIISVKGGKNVTLSCVRDLGGTIDTDGALGGVFVSLDTASPDKRQYAFDQGTFEWDGKQYPKLQFLTHKDLIAGNYGSLPPLNISYGADILQKTHSNELLEF